jgi:hypothetical protein
MKSECNGGQLGLHKELPEITFKINNTNNKTNKLLGLRPQASYTDQAAAACRRS